ncbi:nucleotide-binding protein [Acaryochloris marina]|uniref:nucleotide-binding protein n=1 Tax=Acaryochloris marina TaxID=155978 RepID=UPI001BAEA9C1|nr:nucleotide-binding protein [Acaryochloris marina]QUY41850.1 nucleotide-binding protein [Acaryochloris marina S15]
MTIQKPRVFIGSSSEGLDVARAIQHQLADAAEVVLWNEGVFSLSHGYLETLVDTVKQFDYGIFVLRSDDTLVSRGAETGTTRGNVLFELGLFYGHVGRSRTFAVFDASAKPDVISDLHGVTFAAYRSADQGNLLTAVGPACFTIRQELQNWGQRKAARKVLVLCANPIDENRLRMDCEVRRITRALESARRSGEIVLEQEWAVQAHDLDRLLLLHHPEILHLSCSGTETGGFLFESSDGTTKAVSYDLFHALLRPLAKKLECVLFSCCETDGLAERVSADVPFTIGATGIISDAGATVFTSGFYTAIGNSSDYRTAYDNGVAKFNIDHSDEEPPKMFSNIA